MEWVKFFGDMVSSDYSVFSLVVALAVYVIFRLESFYKLFSDYKTNKFNKLESAISCEYMPSESKDLLQSELVDLHLQEATGIKAAPKLRALLLDVYRKHDGQTRLFHFSRAAELLKIEDGQLKERIWFITKVWLFIEFLAAVYICLGFLVILLIWSWEYSLGAVVDFKPEVLTFPFFVFLFLRDSGRLLSLKYVLDAYHEINGQESSTELKAAA